MMSRNNSESKKLANMKKSVNLNPNKQRSLSKLTDSIDGSLPVKKKKIPSPNKPIDEMRSSKTNLCRVTSSTEKKHTNSQKKFNIYKVDSSYNTLDRDTRANNSRRNNYISTPKKTNNSDFIKSVPKKNIPKKTSVQVNPIENFFDELDKYNEEINNLQNNRSLLFNKVTDILDNFSKTSNTVEAAPDTFVKYSKIWKNFLNNFEKVNTSNSYINNINYSTQNNVIRESSSEYDILRKKYNEIKLLAKERKVVYESQLVRKDKEIKDLYENLEIKEKFIKDLENLVNHLNKKLVECKSPTSGIGHDEEYIYNYKQLMRDYNTLTTENKSLRDTIESLEKDLNGRKHKELKIMKILYYLNNKGINVGNLLEGDTDELGLEDESEKSIFESTTRRGAGSTDSSIFLPLYIDKPMILYSKPDQVPCLNLHDLTSKYNSGKSTPADDGDVGEYREGGPNGKGNLNPLEMELFKTYKNINNKSKSKTNIISLHKQNSVSTIINQIGP
jgi:uncharacterized phage infection (PIP) family protein YhgE